MSNNITDDKKRLWEGYAQAVLNHGATHTITLNFNQWGINPDYARALIKEWDMYVHREILGKRYNKAPLNKRTRFIGFAEHVGSNLHYHLALITPYKERFDQIAPSLWKEVVPSGNLHSHEIITPAGFRDWCRYITKEVALNGTADHIMIWRPEPRD